MRAALRLRSLWPVLFATACTIPATPGAQRNAIVGGTKDTADPGVVLLIGQKPGSQSASLCTGEVVSPHVVLTAAHCVSPAVVGTGLQFQIFLGSSINDPSQLVDSNFVDVAQTHFDSAFNVNKLDSGHDIAVAVTASALPVTPLAVNQDPITDADVGATLRLVGYGITSAAGQDTSGVKRQVSTTLQYSDDLFLAFGDATHNTCEGDSGGPAFMTRNGKEVIVGVTSFGDENCQRGGVDTRVDSYWDAFIAPAIMNADGTLPSPTPSPSPTQSGDQPGVTPGQLASGAAVGASCSAPGDCASGVCTTGSNRYCTAACDPASATSCPDGLHCGQVSGQNYCLLSEGGCSASARSLAGRGAGAGLPLLLLALVGVVRARRRRTV